jgi:PhzF family phenazine biosynthesis protein
MDWRPFANRLARRVSVVNAMKSHLFFYQYDVFAPRIGTGNPLGVVFGAEHWSSEKMQQFAAWTNLVETTFVLPATKAEADYRLRIFTPHKEIAFAGHPTIGSAQAVITHGFATPRQGLLKQECQPGILPIRVDTSSAASKLSVRVPRSKLVRYAAIDDITLHTALNAYALGLSKPALVEGGRRWWLAELADEDSVRRMQPNREAIRQLAMNTDSLGLCVFARSAIDKNQLVVRAFPLGVGIDEDPASGAANAAIAAYLHEVNALHELGHRYSVSQGRELGRDAELQLEIDQDDEIWVGGQSQLVIRAQLEF